MRRAEEFRRTVREGVRSGRRTLVVHVRLTDSPPPRVGFVVSKAVGNAVTRNRTRRRLRHGARTLLGVTPQSAHVVVRALPAAARGTDLLGDLDSAWRSCLAKLGPAA